MVVQCDRVVARLRALGGVAEARGEATAGLFANGKITWKRSKDRLAPDLEKLGQDHPDLLTRYVKPVPGVRRFTIQPLRQTP